ncbi:M23 family metallopeptidase [Polaribacter sp. HL-MS24]|uniref:M23 family metallopeptidase n=1 Tax=Polaribacter sp. HL-MS24 TaxID=3077735 RepID=UPI0029346E9A|nr:M23 family metallopeptidase [Polaribacter sp. HL-MS24]WOC41021.1 M23 family metallopeptidase [Polaribacter sp. HL-MS24]
MSQNKKQKGKFKQKLTDKYRLVVLNEDTFEERFSLKLSRLNVFVLGGFFSIVLMGLTFSVVAFTPIKNYIPGYSSTILKANAINATLKADSLKVQLAILENYTKALRPVLTGELAPEEIDSLVLQQERRIIDESRLNATKEDSLFREMVELSDRFPLVSNMESNVKLVFFAPVSGQISQEFDPSVKHYAVDILANIGAPVKAIADGTVIFSGWTTETGYVLILKHSNNFISVYKHNGNLLKEASDLVQSGEAIASVGSTGKLTTGPHLHFELWSDGYAVDPVKYIDFK